MYAEFARFVGGRRNHSALIGTPAYHHSLALERRIEQLFDGHKKSVHVHMEDGFHNAGLNPTVASMLTNARTNTIRCYILCSRDTPGRSSPGRILRGNCNTASPGSIAASDSAGLKCAPAATDN